MNLQMTEMRQSGDEPLFYSAQQNDYTFRSTVRISNLIIHS